MTFREIERLLVDHFWRAGVAPTEACGDFYVGTCRTHPLGKEGKESVVVSGGRYFDSAAVVSLTELAKLLEREMGR